MRDLTLTEMETVEGGNSIGSNSGSTAFLSKCSDPRKSVPFPIPFPIIPLPCQGIVLENRQKSAA